MSVNEKVKKCIKSGETEGERHKGLRKIAPDIKKAADHVQKAIHNLQAMAIFKEKGYSDWSVSAGFYALYHLLLAILVKEGYESRNQSCTFAVIEKFIEEGKWSIIVEELKDIYDTDIDLGHSDTLLDLRERYQYLTKTEMGEQEFNALKARVKYLFDKLRNDIEK